MNWTTLLESNKQSPVCKKSKARKHIAIAKSLKIGEGYASCISKLCLTRAEEMHEQKKLEELQAPERAHQQYFSMKQTRRICRCRWKSQSKVLQFDYDLYGTSQVREQNTRRCISFLLAFICHFSLL